MIKKTPKKNYLKIFLNKFFFGGCVPTPLPFAFGINIDM
jgi:hypothetical protein